jgi:hypothetical protein
VSEVRKSGPETKKGKVSALQKSTGDSIPNNNSNNNNNNSNNNNNNSNINNNNINAPLESG